MNPLSAVRIGWVLIKLPFVVLRVLAMNMVNMVAPEMMFKMIQRMMKDKEEMAIAKKFKSTEDIGFLFSFDFIKMSVQGEIRDILKEAQVGSPAPNPVLLNLSDRASTSLLSLATPGRPLVINFGSCT